MCYLHQQHIHSEYENRNLSGFVQSLVDKFGIESPFLRTLIGTSFAVEDLWSYAAGTAIACLGVFIYGRIKKKKDTE